MRIIVHPGFHKTGTSSLQACLAANRAALAERLRLVLLDELPAPVRCATRFAVGLDPLDLAAFTASFCETCEGLADTAAPAIVISCEGLSGRTPGKHGIIDYAAALPLAQAMERGLQAVFGRSADVTFLYTTRARQPWLHSAWRHNLAGYRMTLDFDQFCAVYGKAADFAAITDQIRRAVRRSKVVVTPLETVLARPADAILHLLELPGGWDEKMKNPGVKNTGISQGLAAVLLAINRSDVSDAEAKSQRAAAIAAGQDPNHATTSG